MSEPCKPIAVVQGASSPEIQALFRRFVASLRPATRVAGVVEDCAAEQLRSLVDDRVFPLFQDLGPSSTACSLDSESLTLACEAVRRDVLAGCDLVVLSKFGKLEAERAGLAAAFAVAVETQTPILTSLAPKFDAEWRAFAAPLFVMLPPEEAAIRRWWREAAALAA